MSQTDAATTGDHDGFVVEGIVDVWQSGVGAWPRGSVQKRPTGVSSKPANGSGPELLEVVPDRKLSKQGKSGLFPQSSPKNAFRSPQPRFLEVVHGSSHGFSGAEWSVCDLVLQLRGPHLRM